MEHNHGMSPEHVGVWWEGCPACEAEAEVAREAAHESYLDSVGTYDEAVGRAREIGREHGENAIAVWFDTIVSYRPALLLDQVNGGGSWADGNGGPDTNPTLPAPDPSGEGDAPSSADLLDGMDPADVSWGVIADVQGAYELAFSEAVKEAVTKACRDALTQ